MTGKEFINAVANGQVDILGLVLRLLKETSTDYCVIGGACSQRLRRASVDQLPEEVRKLVE